MGRSKRVVRFRTSFSNTIYDVMTSRSWKETDSETDWDVHWAEREWVYEVFDTMHLEPHQRINHFRNGRELCRKDLLVKNLKRMKRNLQRDGQLEQARAYDFMPLSFVLPREYAMFVEEFKRCGGVWIMKPIGSAQGRGIFLFSRLSEISEWRTDPRHLQRDGGDRDSQRAEPEAYIVQRYIENPYLIGGKKFDIRLYVLVTSFSPLVAYMYRGGFARFSHTRYSSDPADIANNFVHLTNVAIQKTAENYDARSGGKKDLRSLKLLLATRHGMAAVDQLFLAIERVIVRSLIAVQHVMIADKHCFELYGYDVRFFRVPWRPAAPRAGAEPRALFRSSSTTSSSRGSSRSTRRRRSRRTRRTTTSSSARCSTTRSTSSTSRPSSTATSAPSAASTSSTTAASSSPTPRSAPTRRSSAPTSSARPPRRSPRRRDFERVIFYSGFARAVGEPACM